MKSKQKLFIDNAKKRIYVSVTDKILQKQNLYSKLSPDTIAKRFWNLTIKNKCAISDPQDKRCKISILVPILDEDVDNLKKQINSITTQKNITPSEYEIIYLINNDLARNLGSKGMKVISSNHRALQYLNSLQIKNVFVIDRSSRGKEIENCNIGKARNILIAESSLRYFKNKKSGILIQTDGDTFFQDPHYLAKVVRLFSNRSIIGVAGGLILHCDTVKKSLLGTKIRQYLLYRKWNALRNFLHNKDRNKYIVDNSFYGANMISRSYESAKIGGVIDANTEEDTRFGKDLERYAAQHNQKIVSKKGTMRVTTLFRPSDRTDSSIKKYLDLIKPHSHIMVQTMHFKKKKFQILSERAFLCAKKRIVNVNGYQQILKYIENNLENIVFKSYF